MRCQSRRRVSWPTSASVAGSASRSCSIASTPAGRTELPFRPASLDGIITTHTIYFVSDLERAFAELADALKSSGEAVIGFGDPAAMEGFTPYGFRIRPVREVLEALERAELTLKKHQQIGQGSGRFHVLLAAPREAAGVQRL